jgi:hypothetical protein
MIASRQKDGPVERYSPGWFFTSRRAGRQPARARVPCLGGWTAGRLAWAARGTRSAFVSLVPNLPMAVSALSEGGH